MAGLGGLINGLFGKESMARQFFVWGVASSAIGAAMGPFLRQLESDVNAKHPVVPLSPPDLADMVVRGILTSQQGAAIAARSGVSGEDFNLLVEDTGEPPSALDLVLLYKRGLISRDDVVRGIKQGRTKNEWIDTMFKLGVQPPTPTDILQALVEGQIGESDARADYEALGGDPKYFQLLYNTRGEAPTPNEAAEMARRGIIPWEGEGPGETSYHQAFLEGHFRNKWQAAYRALSDYIPPPRTVTALYNDGAVTKEQAIELFRKAGLPDVLIESYLAGTSRKKTQKHRDLAETEIGKLYADKAINSDKAKALLVNLGYDETEAGFIITVWDLQIYRTAIEQSITATKSHYIAHKVDAGAASAKLDQLGVPAPQRDALIKDWTISRDSNVKLLTAAEIKKAWKDEIFSDIEAVARLQQLGYTQPDANVYLAL